MRKNNKYNLKLLAFVSILLALAVFLKVYSFGADKFRFSLFAIPLLIAGIVGGPLIGGVAGLLADSLYGFVFSAFPFNPCFTISAILWGVSGGILARKGLKINIIKMSIFILITSVVETTLNTFGMLLWVDPESFIQVITGNMPLQEIISSTAGWVVAGLPLRIILMFLRLPILIGVLKVLDERFVIPFLSQFKDKNKDFHINNHKYEFN